MSTHLYWRPVPTGKNCLDDQLKGILKNRFQLMSRNDPSRIGREQLSYLHGLKDAGIPDADKLIAAIEKHGEIEILIDE